VTYRAVLAAAATAIALSGCGTSALSTPVLRTRATRICRLASTREQRIPTPTAPAGGAAFLSDGALVLRRELRSLRGLDAGGRATAPYARALRDLAAERSQLEASAERLAHDADPVAEIRALQTQLAALESDADDAWQRLGIPACTTR
jgi:hypothetical protein